MYLLQKMNCQFFAWFTMYQISVISRKYPLYFKGSIKSEEEYFDSPNF